MKTKIALILGLLLVATSAGAISFNTDGCQAQKYDTWDALYCPCSGGSGDYEYQYSQLPSGWYANKDRIYIPKGKIENSKVYGAKVSVFDKGNKQYYKRSLLFNYGQDNKLGRVFDADFDFDYDNKANVDQFLKQRNQYYGPSVVSYNSYSNTAYIAGPSNVVPSQVVTGFDPRRQDNYDARVVVVDPRVVVDNRIIPDYRAPLDNRAPVDTRGNPYYDNYPSDDECDRAVANNDYEKIRGFIGYVSNSKFECKSRASFLDKLQANYVRKISSYRTDAEKNRQLNFALQDQIKTLKDNQNSYIPRNVDEINQRIRDYKDQIDQHNKYRGGYENQCKGSRDSIDSLRIQITNIRNGYDGHRRGIDQQERNIRDIQNQIADLERKLQDLKNNREQCRRNRDGYQRNLDDGNKRIDECNIKIKNHQDIIDGYTVKSKTCADLIIDLNKKIDDCNKELNGYGRDRDDKFREIQGKIADLEQQIIVNTREAERLTALFTEMEKYRQEFEETISKQYYGCYQYAPVNNSQDNDDRFSAPSSAFINYMKEVFGQAPNENIRARFSGTVNIRKNTIFSPAWTKVYGIPFSAGYGNNRDISEDNFSCTESSDKLKIFSGRVDDITKNVIQVTSKTGDKYTVHLGGCTKIESVADKQLPEKGQDVYFKGFERKDQNGHFNGYHVTCY